MAKKNLLGDFAFEQFKGIDNGLEIPTTNSLKSEPVHEKIVPKPVLSKKVAEEKKAKRKETIVLPEPQYKGKEVKPLVNVVPTSSSSSDYKYKHSPTKSPSKVVPTPPKVVNTSPKVVPTSPKVVNTPPKVVNTPKRQKIVDSDINLSELGALKTKDEKVVYLAMRGWNLKVEQRRNTLYHYATKYIGRKKTRIYLGSIND